MSDNKSEKPTRKKLEDARKRGEVSISKIWPKAVAIGVFTIWWAVSVDAALGQMGGWISIGARSSVQPLDAALANFVPGMLMDALELVAGLLGSLVFAITLATFLQVGPVWAPEKLAFKLDQMDPIKKVKEWFSLRTLSSLITALVVVTAMLATVWWLIVDNFNSLAWLPSAGPAGVFGVGKTFAAVLLATATLVLLVCAAADVATSKFMFLRDQRMDKQEISRERKDVEGDPHIKSKQREIQRGIASGEIQAAVHRSTAIVANPTHLAIGLRYEAGVTPLPVVTCMGVDGQAMAIRTFAAMAGVPVVESVSLAWALFGNARVNDYIPLYLMEDVADFLWEAKETFNGNYIYR